MSRPAAGALAAVGKRAFQDLAKPLHSEGMGMVIGKKGAACNTSLGTIAKSIVFCWTGEHLKSIEKDFKVGYLAEMSTGLSGLQQVEVTVKIEKDDASLETQYWP